MSSEEKDKNEPKKDVNEKKKKYHEIDQEEAFKKINIFGDE
jgi:hypothetical protein